jgi:tyrosyl-DNA phosphodiesterase-1
MLVCTVESACPEVTSAGVLSAPAPAGDQLHAYGHMKLRECLNNEPGGFPAHFAAAPVLAQYSSIGSLSDSWLLGQFLASAAAGRSGGRPLGPPPLPDGLSLVWPTVSEVQNSVEGWFAGRSIPAPPKNVTREFLQRHYRRWGGAPAGRHPSVPQ